MSQTPSLGYHPSQKVDFGPPPPGYVAGVGRGVINTHTTGGALDGGGRFKGKRIPGQPAESAQVDPFSVNPAAELEGEKMWSNIDSILELPKKRRSKSQNSQSKDQSTSLSVKPILTKLRADEWGMIPDAGDPLARELRNEGSELKEKWTPVPDTYLATSHNQLQSNILVARLESTSSSLKQDDVDVADYLRQLREQETEEGKDQGEFEDVEGMTKVLTKLRRQNPKSPAVWLSSIKAAEQKGEITKARQFALEGCSQCPASEGLWVAAGRLLPPLEAKKALIKGTKSLPQSEDIWLYLVELTLSDRERIDLLREAVEYCRSSEKLWRLLVDQYSIDNPDKRNILVSSIESCPDCLDFKAEYLEFCISHDLSSLVKETSQQLSLIDLIDKAGNYLDIISSVKAETEAILNQQFIINLGEKFNNFIVSFSTQLKDKGFYLSCFIVLHHVRKIKNQNLEDFNQFLIDNKLHDFVLSTFISEFVVNNNVTLWKSFIKNQIRDLDSLNSNCSFSNSLSLLLFYQFSKLNSSTIPSDFIRVSENSNNLLSLSLNLALNAHPKSPMIYSSFSKALLSIGMENVSLPYIKEYLVTIADVEPSELDSLSLLVLDYCRIIFNNSGLIELKPVTDLIQSFFEKSIHTPLLFNIIGQILIDCGERDQALAVISSGLEIFENDEHLLNRKVRLLSQLEAKETILNLINNSIIIPSLLSYYVELSVENLSNQIIGRLRALLERCLKISNSDNCKVSLWLILVDFELKISLNSALSAISRALKSLPVDCRGPLYSKYLEICPPPLRKSITREAVQLLPNCPYVLSSSGLVLYQQGVSNKAKKFIERSLVGGNVNIWSKYVKFLMTSSPQNDLSRALTIVDQFDSLSGIGLDCVLYQSGTLFFYNSKIVKLMAETINI
ncbi:hypothetical protein P9112_008893 [Eukaryota sp. TZLM1-RC]